MKDRQQAGLIQVNQRLRVLRVEPAVDCGV